jgi:hypothetical protein
MDLLPSVAKTNCKTVEPKVDKVLLQNVDRYPQTCSQSESKTSSENEFLSSISEVPCAKLRAASKRSNIYLFRPSL